MIHRVLCRQNGSIACKERGYLLVSRGKGRSSVDFSPSLSLSLFLFPGSRSRKLKGYSRDEIKRNKVKVRTVTLLGLAHARASSTNDLRRGHRRGRAGSRALPTRPSSQQQRRIRTSVCVLRNPASNDASNLTGDSRWNFSVAGDGEEEKEIYRLSRMHKVRRSRFRALLRALTANRYHLSRAAVASAYPSPCGAVRATGPRKTRWNFSSWRHYGEHR